MENRFYIDKENDFLVDRKGEMTIGFNDRVDFIELCDFLNKQENEIIELKEAMKRIMIDLMEWNKRD